MSRLSTLRSVSVACIALCSAASAQDRLERIQYNNPGLEVDLGVGLWAWPLPMDYDRDGDLDLVVSCPDKPYNGTYFFENPGEGRGLRVKGQGDDAETKPSTLDPPPSTPLPIFKPAVRIADGPTNVQVSYVGGEPVVMTPAKVYADFRERQYDNPIKLPLPEKIDPQYKRYRANQWRLVDWEGDGDLDVVIGIEIWDDYGWDDAWDENGNWMNGPLHGFVYLVENVVEGRGSRVEGEGKKLADDQPWPEMLGPRPLFAPAVMVTTSDGKPVDVYGMPSPNFADFDGDGDLDLICGEFLDGFTYFENKGTRASPGYDPGRPVERPVYINTRDLRPVLKSTERIAMDLQMITPVVIDWDHDGAPDIVCGDEDGRVALLSNTRGFRLADTERRVPGSLRVLEWTQLQHLDTAEQQKRLQESGAATPMFARPRYFQQFAADVKFGALVTPVGIDWDRDGHEDLICGNTAGHIAFIKNLSGGRSPRWAAPELIAHQQPYTLGAQTIRHQAGRQGSIQGPCEAKWGYTAPTATDWDHDGVADLIVNDIWGKVRFYAHDNRTETYPALLAKPKQVSVVWHGPTPRPAWTWWTPEPGELVTQWRTTPCVLDWNGDGLSDLVMLDHEGYLAFFEREKRGDELVLLPPQRLFEIDGPCEFDQKHKPVGDNRDGLLRLNANRAGASGRRKLCFADWDGDGRLDLLVNSVNVNWLRNVRTDDEGFTWFHDEGPLDDRVLAGHDTSPTVVDWDRNGIPDLLVGAEDGHLYYKRNPRAAEKP